MRTARRRMLGGGVALGIAALWVFPPPALRDAVKPFTSQPQAFTGLSFVNHDQDLAISSDGTFVVTFQIDNEGGAAHTYRWDARVVGGGAGPADAANGSITVDGGASAQVTAKLVVAEGPARVVVGLPTDDLSIHRAVDGARANDGGEG